MSNLFGELLNMMRAAKQEAIEDMKWDLLRKHPDFPKDKILVQEITLPGGKTAVRVSLRDGFDDIDFQTATFEPSVKVDIVREVVLPEHHPDYDKYNKKEEEW